MIFRYLSTLNRGSECPLQGFTFRKSLQETPGAFDNMTFVANPTLRRTADTFTSFTSFTSFTRLLISLITSDVQNDNFLADIKDPERLLQRRLLLAFRNFAVEQLQWALNGKVFPGCENSEFKLNSSSLSMFFSSFSPFSFFLFLSVQGLPEMLLLFSKAKASCSISTMANSKKALVRSSSRSVERRVKNE